MKDDKWRPSPAVAVCSASIMFGECVSNTNHIINMPDLIPEKAMAEKRNSVEESSAVAKTRNACQ